MKAAVFRGINDLRLEEVEKPICGDSGILLKVMACGICGSDLRILKHGNARVQPGAIMGHEVTGVIEEVGQNVQGFSIGDRIALSSDVPCGECNYCKEGYCNNCETDHLAIGHQLPGGFAEYLAVDKRVWNGGAFHKIPDHVSFEEAALAEPLACAINGVEMIHGRYKDTCAIIGSGVLGSLLAQLMRIYGYKKIFLIDIDAEKLSFIKSIGIPADEFVVFDESLAQKISSATNGRGIDAVITACGDPATQKMALNIVGKRGWINFFAGLPATAPDVQLSPNLLHYREITITGSHGSTPETHKKALQFISEGKVNTLSIVTHSFPLHELNKALFESGGNNRLKVIINP